jgi:general secretion pathway protein A
MYLSFFRLARPPFGVTPDPEFLFLSSTHREALAAVVYGVEQRKGFVAVTGEVGVGKTTVLRSYLENVDRERTRAIYLFNPNVTFDRLLAFLLAELGRDAGPAPASEMAERLHAALLEEYRQGRNIVLVVDEAQAMPVETLERLRLLSNLETASCKLIQVVLAGQPELERILEREELRQLRQRIAVQARILPLSREESVAYMKHRLAKAANREGDIFTPGSLRMLARRAKGIPRTMNILCDNALVTAFGYQRRKVGRKTVAEILADRRNSGRPVLKGSLALWILVLFAAFYAFGMAGAYLYGWMTGRPVVAGRDAATLSAPAPGAVRGHVTAASESRPMPARGSPLKVPPGEVAGRDGISRVVHRGDSLSLMVVEVYGTLTREAVERVLRNNPDIRNPDMILPGAVIVFPRPDRASERQR